MFRHTPILWMDVWARMTRANRRAHAPCNDLAPIRIVVLAFLLMAGPAMHAVAAEATGAVFHDENANNTRDEGEAGIPNVCVSNGRDVTRTDAEGRWTLPAQDDMAFYVVKPTGWAPPLNEDNLPQFYYLHKDQGSPTRQSPGVDPTGPLPAQIDFPLRRQEEGPFKVLLFGDTQARGLREVNYVTRDVVEECIGSDAAFGITLGDIVADDPALFAEVSSSTGCIGIPWYYVFGNHDHNRDAIEDRYRDETFERYFGPSTYAFEYGGVSFIVLKNMVFPPEGRHENRFTDDQLTFVRDYLGGVPREQLIVLLMHVPIVVCKNRDAMLALIEDRPHTLSVSAHTHEQAHLFLDASAGWNGAVPHHHFISPTVCGSWWCGLMDERGIPHATMNDGGPNGYSIVTFDGPSYSIRFKAARRPADYQMNVYTPDEVAVGEEAEIQVNVFAGSERSTVEMQVDGGGPWTPLTQFEGVDPDCLRMFELSPYLDQTVNGKPLDEVMGWKMDYPSKTRHMWRGTLPSKLAPGAHTVAVRTTDMFGQVYNAYRVVRVRPRG